MQFAIDKYASIQVRLCSIAKMLILFHYLLIKLVHVFELLIGGSLMAVHLKFDLGSGGCQGQHSLDAHEMITTTCISLE